MKIDDNIAAYAINNNIFRNIHPNIITLFGFFCNFLLIMPQIYSSVSSFTIIFILRYLADGIDGAVARKYKKTSKLGNILDTLSDFTFAFIMFAIMFKKYLNLSYLTIFLMYDVFILMLIIKYNIFSTHSNLKEKKDNQSLLDKLTIFFTNNSIILYIILYLGWIYPCSFCKYSTEESIIGFKKIMKQLFELLHKK